MWVEALTFLPAFVVYLTVVAVFFLAATLAIYRERIANSLIARFEFRSLYRLSRVVESLTLILYTISLAVLVVLISGLLTPSSRQTVSLFGVSVDLAFVAVISLVIASSIGVACYALWAYTAFFSLGGLASLCIKQAQLSPPSEAGVWLNRGFVATAARLQDFYAAISPNRMLFAINMKDLRGEPVDSLLDKIAMGILDSSSAKQSHALYKAIRELNNEVERARKDGFKMRPTYRERTARLWNILSKSTPLILVMFTLFLAALSYALTGRISVTLPP